MIHAVQMLCNAVNLTGRVFDGLLSLFGCALRLLCRRTRSICRCLCLLGLQLSSFCF